MDLLFRIDEGCYLHAVVWWKAEKIFLYYTMKEVYSKEGSELRKATMLEF